MKILVTGGAGFIGSHLVDALVKKGYQVRVLDNLDSQTLNGGKLPAYFNKEAEFIKGDIRSKKDFKKAIEGVEIIYHLAAAISLAQSMYQIKKYEEINLGGVANLLEILTSAKNKVKKVIFASSATVYGEGAYRCPGERMIVYPKIRSVIQIKKGEWEPLCPNCQKVLEPIPTSEEKPLQSQLLYAITKETGEKMFLSLGRAYDIPCTVLRYFNVYGPRQGWNNPHTAVWAVFLARIKRGFAPIVIEDGLQTRDFIYVEDVIKATVKAMETKKSDFKIINVGSGASVTIRKVAEELIKLSGRGLKPKITYVFRKGDVRHCFADISKAGQLLGWEPKVTFEEGVKRMVEWGEKEKAGGSLTNPVKVMIKKGLAVYGRKNKD